MKTNRILAAAALIVASALAPDLALAQCIKRTDLMRDDLSAPGREVIQALVEFVPGVTVKAGEVLFIPHGTPHAVKNAGRGNAAELATYIVEKGKPLLVPDK